MLKLNLGCGTDIRKGFVNLDVTKLPGVDIVWNVNKTPLPFKDVSVSEINCRDILEHVDYIRVLRDLHRILNKNGKIIIRVPHFTSKNQHADPTHLHSFSRETFSYFVKGHNRSYYFDFTFTSANVEIEFDKRWYLPYNCILEFIVNLNWRTQALYETTPLRIFPANCIRATLTK